MNLIPKINGRVVTHKGKLTVYEPISFHGKLHEEAWAMRFGLIEATDGLLYFSEDPAIPKEGYKLTVSVEGIEISASDRAGQFYGLITLQHLLREGRSGLLELNSKIPYMEIEDAPRYSHRGFMLDVSRHFTGALEVERLLEQMALLKLNIFHWHLSDDQGFRIERKKFPKLNSVGSASDDVPATDGSKRQYYTQEEIREVVAFAAERCITVIPEIDLPGHTSAIVAAYPELSCTEAPMKGLPQGFTDERRILCAGKEQVYTFLYQLLEEVCGLFPGPYFHLGGDEVPKEAWKACEACQRMIRDHQLDGEEGLQAYFTEQLIHHLNSLGKTAIGWNEILKSGTLSPESALVQFWSEELMKPTDKPYVMREMPKGYSFIFSSNPAFYFDYSHALVTLKATYNYEPNVTNDYNVPAGQVRGLECCLWTERVPTVENLQKKIFPRLIAMAENAWCKDRSDYEDFLRRLKAYQATLDDLSIAYTPVEQMNASPKDAVKEALAMIQFPSGSDKGGNKELPAGIPEFLITILRFVFTNAMMYSYTEEEKKQIMQEIEQQLGL